MERSSLADISVGHKFNEYATNQQQALKKVLDETSQKYNPITGQPIAVPVKYEETYDPQDSRADWSGFVPNPSGRARPTNNPSAYKVQVSADSQYNGLVPSESANTSDWKHPSRKMKENQRSTTFNLIGGPTPVNNPGSLHDTSQWETEAQAAARRSGTYVDQLTTGGKVSGIYGFYSTRKSFEQ